MTLAAQSESSYEKRALEHLREKYTQEGYSFIPHPGREDIPAFFGSYRPDAIAVKQGANFAIEIKQAPSRVSERSLQEIRRLFEGQTDWQLVVSYGGDHMTAVIEIPRASLAEMRSRLAEVRALGDQGQRTAAFVLGWSLLEAALHNFEGESAKRPRTPGTVIEALATLGYLSPEIERQLRVLISLRNRIVHGDLSAEPSTDDLEVIFTAIEQALS